MFYILCTIGIGLIIAGLYIERTDSEKSEQDEGIDIYESIMELQNELRKLKEKIPQSQILQPEEDVKEEEAKQEESSFQNVMESVEEEIKDNQNASLTKYKLLLEYEEKNYSMEDICMLLNMKKGEVILLKNLYKDY